MKDRTNFQITKIVSTRDMITGLKLNGAEKLTEKLNRFAWGLFLERKDLKLMRGQVKKLEIEVQREIISKRESLYCLYDRIMVSLTVEWQRHDKNSRIRPPLKCLPAQWSWLWDTRPSHVLLNIPTFCYALISPVDRDGLNL